VLLGEVMVVSVVVGAVVVGAVVVTVVVGVVEGGTSGVRPLGGIRPLGHRPVRGPLSARWMDSSWRYRRAGRWRPPVRNSSVAISRPEPSI